jgi:CRISPR-associated protein Csa1
MFHATFEKLWTGETRLDFLDNEATKAIKTRGYSSAAQVPSDLANSKWFLAINDIAYSYCPTNRYLFFRKVEGKRPAPTWESFKGRIIDELIPEIYKKVYEYSTKTSLRNFKIIEEIKTPFNEFIQKCKSDLKADTLLFPPSTPDVEKFFADLSRLGYYEAEIASALLNFRVSNIYDMNVDTEFKLLFPFDFKLKICAPILGVSGSAELDFLIRKSILGEIKSNEWYEFYNVGLAGYALALEADRKRDLNLGIILCPMFVSDRTVPMYYSNAGIRIISEPWRKMFLVNRNSRIELVKNAKDPGTPENDIKCKACGFFKACWP